MPLVQAPATLCRTPEETAALIADLNATADEVYGPGGCAGVSMPADELQGCDACGEADDPDAMIENERGAVICTECQEADEHYESTYSPESDTYFDGGE